MPAAESRSPSRRGRRPALTSRQTVYEWSALLLALAPSFIGPWLFGGVRLWSVAILVIFALLSALLTAARPFIFQLKGHPLFPAPLVAFAAFVVFAAVRIPFSAVPAEAMLDVLRLCGLLASAWTIVELAGGQHGRWRWIAGLFLLSVSIMCLYAFVQDRRGSNMVLFLLRPEVYADRASGAFICPNHFASLIGIALPLALALASTRDAGATRIFACYALVALPPALYLTQSRSGWLGALAGLAVAWIVLAARRNRRGFFIALLTAPLVAAVLAFTVWAASPMVRTRVEDALRGNARTRVWHDTRAMIADAPLLGWGPGAYRWVYPRYWHHLKDYIDPEHPHSEPLELLAEHGVVGAGLAVTGLLVAAAGLLRGLRSISRDKDGVLIAASFGTGTAALVHACFDFNLHVFSVASGLLLIPALAFSALHSSGVTRRWETLGSRGRRGLAIGAGVLAVVALVLTMRALTADLLFRAAERHRLGMRREAAERFYALAAGIDSSSWQARTGWGHLLRTMATWNHDAEARKADSARAEELYRAALRINPCHLDTEVSLALLYRDRGELDRAIETLQALVARVPRHRDNQFRLGLFLRQAGRPAEALDAFRRAREVNSNEAIELNIHDLEKQARPPIR